MMASPAGGMEIEKVAVETPELIFKEYVEPGNRTRLSSRRRSWASVSAWMARRSVRRHG